MKNFSYYKSEIERLTLQINTATGENYTSNYFREFGGWLLIENSPFSSRFGSFGVSEYLSSREMYAYLVGINRALNIIS